MTTKWLAWRLAAGVVLSCIALPAFAQVIESDVLQRKQEDQQRARTLTRDLVGGVLDVQLRQLEENGLTDQEIYRDIKLMRQNLTHLVETEMSQVVELLAETQRMPREKREASFVEARQQIRAIVRQLAVERRNLLKRLKIAELVEQVQRLIRQQTSVQAVTKRLPQEQQAKQETLTLKAIEDQRDIKELYLQLIETMVDMKSWNGVLAAAAADGLRITKAADIGLHVDEASRNLQAVKYAPAYDEQDLVLRGLFKLLTVIERTQGALNSERNAASDRIRALVEKQKRLRDETARLPENQLPPPEMVERQSQLQTDIARLQELLRANPKAEPLIQQAQSAAMDAAASLLDNQREEAQAHQGKVLANLAAVELSLKEPDSERARDKSADELAQLAQALNQTKSQLVEAKAKQDQTAETAKTDAQAAANTAKEVAELLQSIDMKIERPAAVETSLGDAAEAATQSAKQLESAPHQPAAENQKAALATTSKAIDRAINTVSAAIAETERLEAAIKIGELARAAEVLERAAAEERAIARESQALEKSAESNQPEATLAKELAERQQNLQAIAEKTSEAIARTAPQASTDAAEAGKHAASSNQALQKLAEAKSDSPAQTAHAASESAAHAAQKMTDSAKQIREEIARTAKAVADRAAAQADRLAESRKAIETAVDQLPSTDPVTRLQAARDKLSDAMQEQAKAQGKPEAAASMRLADQVASALDAQDAAEAAALAADSGIGSELSATTRQEEVAEKSQAAMESAAKRPQAKSARNAGKPDALAQALNEAHQAASQAAKQTLDGDLASAKASRKSAEDALKRALTQAQAESMAATEALPTAPPDAQAQAKAAADATEAQQLASKANLKAGNEVAPAAMAAEAANQALAAKSDQAPVAQAKSADALRQAQRVLNAAILKASVDQAKSLADQSQLNTGLADRVANVDPSAADSVDRAAHAAKMGSQAGHSPQQMSTAAKIAESALENAVANLGAKEQEIHRDLAIAESIANLAHDQQMAADEIAAWAKELEERTAAMKEGEAPAAALQTAAQKLNDAQQQFADSQRATGQGAVELSGQKEVANPPLREALDLASGLPTAELAMTGLPDSMSLDRQAMPAGSSSELPDEAAPIAKDLAAANSTDEPADGQSKRSSNQSTPASAKPNGLGTGFIPRTPELTAEMMAGPKAQKEAQKALGQLPMNEADAAKQTAKSRRSNPQEQEDELGEERGASSKLSQNANATSNQKVRDGSVDKQKEGTSSLKAETGQSREAEESIQARQFKDEAWFAKLPPELRKSIRTGAGQKAPRAYEERLKKYFQSVD